MDQGSKVCIKAKHTVLREQTIPIPTYPYQTFTSEEEYNTFLSNNSQSIPHIQSPHAIPHEPTKAAVGTPNTSIKHGAIPKSCNGTLPTTVKIKMNTSIEKLRPVNKVDPLQSPENVHACTCIGIMSTRKINRISSAVLEQNVEEASSDMKIYSDLLRISEEKDSLKAELDKQVEVNVELKKLLVASLGDDLQYRLERLARDNAQLSLDVGDYTHKANQDYETLEAMTIQADMWRSKFLASRLMIDELANWKAHLYMQCKDTQNVLNQILQEHHEIKQHLTETYWYLKQAMAACESRSHMSSNKSETKNLLTLSLTNKRLAEHIQHYLIGGSSGKYSTEHDCSTGLTPAETIAQRVIASEKTIAANLAAPEGQTIERFHPMTRYENLTFSYCKHCMGEERVV